MRRHDGVAPTVPNLTHLFLAVALDWAQFERELIFDEPYIGNSGRGEFQVRCNLVSNNDPANRL
jgi:hypothetical protein